MLAMRKDKAEVLQLRKLGKSYNEIRQQIRIPKSTLSEWLGKIGWSKKIKRVLIEKSKEQNAIHLRKLDKIRGEHLARIYEEARSEARKEFKHFKLYPLFITGISVYWGEGDRATEHQVKIVNTDPKMIRLFVYFLQKICNVPQERIRAYILLYPDLVEKECREFWTRESTLPAMNFGKSTVIQGRHKTRRIPHGVCTVGVSSKYLKQKMLLWLDMLPDQLLKMNRENAVIV